MRAAIARASGVLGAGRSWIGTGSAVERLWSRPAITVTGFDAPKVAGASNTLVPVARARVTVRLAPGDTSANAAIRLREHLEKHVPWGARLTTTVVDAGEPTVLPTAGPAYDAARSALAEAWDGVTPVDKGSGGSIPSVGAFKRDLQMDSLLVGFALEDDRIHSPNEKYERTSFHRGARSWARILAALAA